ncbi:sheath initiation protein [Bacillus phage SP-15]|uniref:Sheath initiation protein n=1 Tax=Bacillus phage SP-15 TaxID=1792032 RepID=A0A127AW49_9CAUD|nr:sheath initiation protein [Bacillus phage SP-15]AMM44852.1 sheath initiation protein [Bacillus phage SP-15]
MRELDELQLRNIGKGLDLTSLFSTITGKVNYNQGFDRINQSLFIIFGTLFSEAPMLPILGSNLSHLLFEPSDDILEELVELYLREAIENLEPRIAVSRIVVNTDDHYVYITVEYILTNANIAGQFDYRLTRQTRGDYIE